MLWSAWHLAAVNTSLHKQQLVAGLANVGCWPAAVKYPWLTVKHVWPHLLWLKEDLGSGGPCSCLTPSYLMQLCKVASVRAAELKRMLRLIIDTSPSDLLPAVYLISNRIAPAHAAVELGIGEALVKKVLALAM